MGFEFHRCRSSRPAFVRWTKRKIIGDGFSPINADIESGEAKSRFLASLGMTSRICLDYLESRGQAQEIASGRTDGVAGE